MNSNSDDNDSNKATGKGTGGKGSSSGGGPTGHKTPPPMSSAFFEVMKEKGVSAEQIAKIITDWAHHQGSQLTERIKQFIEGIQKATDPVSRASANLIISFSNLGFAVVSNLLSYMTAEMAAEYEHSLRTSQTTKPQLSRT